MFLGEEGGTTYHHQQSQLHFVTMTETQVLKFWLPKLETNVGIAQWWSQEFRLGGARLKDKIGSKKLI